MREIFSRSGLKLVEVPQPDGPRLRFIGDEYARELIARVGEVIPQIERELCAGALL